MQSVMQLSTHRLPLSVGDVKTCGVYNERAQWPLESGYDRFSKHDDLLSNGYALYDEHDDLCDSGR